MKQYQEKINEAGGFEKLSKGLKKLVKLCQEGENDIIQLKRDLENATEEELPEIEKDIKEGENLLKESEEELLHKIERYLKNKDAYAEKMKNMREKNPKFQDKSNGTESELKPKAEQAPESAPAPAPMTAAQGQAVITKSGGSEPQVVKAEVVEEKEEGGFGSMLLWGALGVAGIFIGINLFKNRN